MTDLSNLSNNFHEWTKDHVKLWVTEKLKLDPAVADILFDEDVTGNILKDLTKEDFVDMGIKKGPASSIINNLKALTAQTKVNDQNHPRNISGQQAQQTNSATPPVDKKDINPFKTEETSHKQLRNPESISSDQVQGFVRVTPHHFDTSSGSRFHTKHADLFDTGEKKGPASSICNNLKALTAQPKVIDQNRPRNISGQQAQQTNNATPPVDKKDIKPFKTEEISHKQLGNPESISSDQGFVRVTPHPFDTSSGSKSYTKHADNLKALNAQPKANDQNIPMNIIGQQAQQTNSASPPIDKADTNPVKKEETSHKEIGNPESISSDQVQGFVRVTPQHFDTSSGSRSHTKHADNLKALTAQPKANGQNLPVNIIGQQAQPTNSASPPVDKADTHPVKKEETSHKESGNPESISSDQVHVFVTVTPDHFDTSSGSRAHTKHADFFDMGKKRGPASSIANNLKALTAQPKVIDQNRPRNISGQQAQQTNNASPPVDKKDINPFKTEETSHKQLGNPESISSDQVQGFVRVTPHPFDTTSGSKSYTKHHLLPPESGTFNYIDPIHEYKEFTNTSKATKEDTKMKFCNEVFRFAAACMNARTNGTIHFGVRDDPHGEVIGVCVVNSEKYVKCLDEMIGSYFEKSQLELAKKCIRPPRFVSVLNEQNTRSDLVVIEVDVVPEHAYCKSQIFYIFQYVCTESVNKVGKVDKKWRKSKEKYCYLRDGGSSKDMLANLQKDSSMTSLFSDMEARDKDRKRAEDERKKKQKCNQVDGFKLSRLLTGNRNSLDNSYYKWYILVANKCHESHKNHLAFIQELNWFAILDFDPESLTNGLCKVYQEERKPNLHFPHQYPKIENFTQENIEELKLYQQPSWIFCNGRLDLQSEDYQPLNHSTWQEEKADDVRNLVSIFSKKDIMEQGKFLVVFLLLSTVEDPMDPMNEVFRAFFQKLKSMADILCICGNEETFQRWKDLQARLMGRSGEEMEERCIYNLDIENLNGTILRLKSTTRSASRFLPSHGGSSTILRRKDEDLMTSLDILCVNECQDTEIENNTSTFNEFLKTHEEHFYRGGKATWWNFYFSSKQYTGPFIKRDVHEKLKEQVESWSKCEKQRSVNIFTLFHHPGCGGTTTAMHVLWELRNMFRCAVLNRKTDKLSDIGKEVVSLAVYGSPSGKECYPVLLLVDDYNDEESVSILRNNIQSAIAERYIRYETPVVIILSCMRSQEPEKRAKSNCTSSVALTYKLSTEEQRAFATKLKEMEKQHKNPDNFYSFMIMKNNFEKSYIETTVRNTLKGLNSASKTTQLISFLALLNKYMPDSTISASMCEEFLGITAKKTYWQPESIEDTVGSYSTILIRTEVEECGRYEGLRIIHPLIACQCIEELKSTYDIQQSRIMLNMLKTYVFHDIGIGREMLIQNMQNMLVKRHRKEHGDDTDTSFSPLIEEIQKTEGNSIVEHVLKEGTKRFNKSPYICQALARHFYIKERNYTDAFVWAKNAVNIAPTNSFILDTLGQIYKSQLKDMLDSINKDNPISPEQLDNLLKIAYTASQTFKTCQEQTEKTEIERSESEKSKARHYNVYNTGYLGQIEVCLYTVDILHFLPWINSKDSLSRKHLTQYLSGKWDISVDNASEAYEEFNSVLSDHRPFLIKLKSCLKKAFDFFQDYYVYMKEKTVFEESTEFKIRVRVSKHRKKYNQYFCDHDLMQIANEKDQRKKSPLQRKEECRAGLEKYKADRFSGILEYLTDHKMDDKIMETIVKTYKYLLENSTHDSYDLLRDKQNFILANIILHCISPKSTEITPVETLEKHLKEIMNNIGLDHKYPEPYFLASLLFWPQNPQKLDSNSKLIAEYVISMRKSFRGKYRQMSRAKQPLAHFYLGKNSGLKRIIHKGKIDQYFSDVPVSDLNSLWLNGEIWKEAAIKDLLLRVNGRTEEDDKIYVECSNKISIPVRPVYLGQLRSGRSIERVTFYLGFSLDGLIAYDIEIMK